MLFCAPWLAPAGTNCLMMRQTVCPAVTVMAAVTCSSLASSAALQLLSW
jgi:hypothetical protein